jgi:hypothetical protein
MEAFNYLALTIGNYYDSGSFSLMANALAALAGVFDGLDRYETAARMAGFATTPLTRTLSELHTTIAHLRAVLGEEAYAALADAGREKTNAGMAVFALDEIDRARAALQSGAP